MLQQSPRGGDEDVHPHHRRLLLAELLLAPRDQPRRQLVVLAEDTQHLEDLEGQLSRRGDDECCQAVSSSAASRRGAIDNRRQNAGTRNSLGQRAGGGNSQQTAERGNTYNIIGVFAHIEIHQNKVFINIERGIHNNGYRRIPYILCACPAHLQREQGAPHAWNVPGQASPRLPHLEV